METKTIKISISIFFLATFLFTLSCNDVITNPDELCDNKHKVTIKQGVWGNVRFWEGDFMPSTDNSSSGTITPVVRPIYIHEATTFDMVEREYYGVFCTKVNSKLITIIESDRDGFFQIELEPGKYSFFVKEDSLFYGNRSDSDGHIEAAEVFTDSTTQVRLNITYNATF